MRGLWRRAGVGRAEGRRQGGGRPSKTLLACAAAAERVPAAGAFGRAGKGTLHRSNYLGILIAASTPGMAAAFCLPLFRSRDN